MSSTIRDPRSLSENCGAAILGCTGFTIFQGRAGKDACTTIPKTAFLRQAPSLASGCVGTWIRGCSWEPDGKGRSFPHLALKFDLARVIRDDSLRDGHSQAESFE